MAANSFEYRNPQRLCSRLLFQVGRSPLPNRLWVQKGNETFLYFQNPTAYISSDLFEKDVVYKPDILLPDVYEEFLRDLELIAIAYNDAIDAIFQTRKYSIGYY